MNMTLHFRRNVACGVDTCENCLRTPGTERNPEKKQPIQWVQFATPLKVTFTHWLFFLGYVPYLELRLVLKLSNAAVGCKQLTKKSEPGNLLWRFCPSAE